MPYYEYSGHWEAAAAATTGALPVHQIRGKVERLSVYFATGPGCTCTISLQTAPESTGPWIALGSAANLSTSATQIQQYSGPLAYIRPYITAKTTGLLLIDAMGN